MFTDFVAVNILASWMYRSRGFASAQNIVLFAFCESEIVKVRKKKKQEGEMRERIKWGWEAELQLRNKRRLSQDNKSQVNKQRMEKNDRSKRTASCIHFLLFSGKLKKSSIATPVWSPRHFQMINQFNQLRLKWFRV